MRTILAAAAAMLCLAGGAHAAGIKTVKDWTGVCNNIGSCQAFGFTAEDAENEAYLVVKRAAGPAAQPTVAILYDPGDTQGPASWRLLLDGHAIAGVGPLKAAGGDNGARVVLSGGVAAALIEALRNGQALDIEADGKQVAAISLSGSAAVLLWVDDQQGRVGTVTALARKGPKSAGSVPPPAPIPVIAVARPISQAGLPKVAPKSLIKTDPEDCDHDQSGVAPDDIIARLSPGVVLWAPECSMAAYNMSTIAFLGDEHAGHLRRIKFPEGPGAGQASDDFLTNAGFDPKTQTISMFDKARGIADCGESADWVWNGQAFVLLDEQVMPVCHGVVSDDWPSLFVGKRG